MLETSIFWVVEALQRMLLERSLAEVSPALTEQVPVAIVMFVGRVMSTPAPAARGLLIWSTKE